MTLRALISVIIGCAGLSGLWASEIDQPSSPYERGKLEFQAKNYSAAADFFEKAEVEHPATSDALLFRAKALSNLGQYEDAEKSLRQFLVTRPRSADATYLLGYVLFRRNQPSQSLAVYTAAAQLQRPTADDFKVVGLNYVLLNDNTDAIRWLEKSVSEGPSQAEPHYFLGRAYYVQNWFDKAVAQFERALEIDPAYAKAENNLGLALEAKGLLDEAEAAYRKAIQMGKTSGKESEQPYLNLADRLGHTRREQEALELLATAERIGGKTGRSEELKGKALFAEDRLSEAEAAFRSALQLKGDSSSLHYELGRVLKREGKTEEANLQFQQTKQMLGSHSSAQ